MRQDNLNVCNSSTWLTSADELNKINCLSLTQYWTINIDKSLFTVDTWTNNLTTRSRTPYFWYEGRTGRASGNWFRNRKMDDHGSCIWKFWFPKSQKYSSKILFLMTCSYTRKSVWRRQNHEWQSQGSMLQIAHLSHSRQTTNLSIRPFLARG